MLILYAFGKKMFCIHVYFQQNFNNQINTYTFYYFLYKNIKIPFVF